MELLTAVALLCQLNGWNYTASKEEQLKCQQYYVHCVGVKNDAGALKQCILEKK